MSMSKVSNKRQTLMLFSTKWLEGSRGFFFFLSNNNNVETAQNRSDFLTPLNRKPLQINGGFHANDINIAQLQMTNC